MRGTRIALIAVAGALAVVGGIGIAQTANSASVEKEPAAIPQPSATVAAGAELSAALADGIVTHDEYLAGFDRYSGCMAARGFPLIGVHDSNQVMQYSMDGEAVWSGADRQCYDSEFGALDSSWQVQRADTSEGAAIWRSCLQHFQLTPDPTEVGMNKQLRDASITIETCIDLWDASH